MENAHTLEGAAVCARLSVDPRAGLTPAQVAAQQAIFGRNELPPPESTPFYKLVLKQFEDFLVLILLAAAVISFFLALFEEGEDRVTAFVEPAVILCILIANATVGVIQETNAEKSIEALRKSEARDATVLRGGLVQSVPSVELVPGDIIIISVGDKVPADARVLKIETATLSVDEAMLTGESVPAQKGTGVIADVNAVAAERRNMVFSGTLVVRGKATAVVCQTAANTAMGDIASSLSEEEDEKTPLQQKLDEFGELLTKVIGVICVVVWVINIGHFTDPEHGSFVKGAIYYFKIAVALAVAAIPEGLPAVVTTCLALGTMKMAKKNAIVRKLPSVETLGCTTVICSDKTGTLTTNKMSVQHVVVVSSVSGGSAAFREFTVAGDSYAPFGVISDVKGRSPLTLPAVEEPALAEVGKICALCNESDLQYVVEPGKEVGVYSKTGVPTEAALKVLAEKIGVPDRGECDQIFRSRDPFARVSAANNYWKGLYERERVLEFDRNRKSMSVLVREAESGSTVLLVKGAPESILDRCTRVRSSSGQLAPLTAQMREQLLFHYNQLAQRGLRCLALSYVNEPDPNSAWGDIDRFGDIESDMVFVGLTGMLDPPRAMVNKSIAKCHQAGIRVIVITGDNQATAESICRLIGVFGPSEDVSNKSFTGSEFAAMPAHKQRDVVRHASLFSRVEPRHKHRLVELLKDQGEIVAMTGDGVNDAPALKAAHIGVAMGSGTDVAREASHMVLQDDNFATIVMAVEEGRAIFSNTKQFIRYLISSNIGEVACIFLTAAFGMPEALIPVQLLWVNLVTDGLPATALGFNPPDPDIMHRPPRGQDEGIVNGWMFFRYLAIGLYVGLGTVGGFIWWFLYYPGGPGLSWKQLTEFHSCSRAVAAGAAGAASPASALFPPGFDCGVFHNPSPSSVSLSILVTIEMFNALNALSENQSLLVVPPWSNLWVLLAVALSFALHFVILYVPFFAHVFKVAPLSWEEWQAVLSFSAPVVVLDEVLKFISRNTSRSRTAPSKKRR